MTLAGIGFGAAVAGNSGGWACRCGTPRGRGPVAPSEVAASRGRAIRLPGSCLRRKESRHTLEIGIGRMVFQLLENTLHRLIGCQAAIGKTPNHE
jgi:hypothetical protein